MADLTVLSSLTPLPVYPSRSKPSRPGFSSTNPSFIASSSRLDLSLLNQAQPTAARPTLSRLDLSGRGKAREHSTSIGSVDPDSPSLATTSTFSSSATTSPEEEQQNTHSPDDDTEAETPRQPYYTDRNTDIISPIPRKPSQRPTHRPTRSRSAPPERTTFVSIDDSTTPTTITHTRDPFYPNHPASAGFSEPGGLRRLKGGRKHSDSGSTSSSSGSPVSSWSYDSPTRRVGEILKPPPPLHRPTTFWRNTPRSGVTSSSYSPSTHLVRRSTFIAAGLKCESPGYDGSALAVESRMAADPSQGKLSSASQVFWEVII